MPGNILIPGNLPLQWNKLTTLTVGGPKWNVPATLTSDVLLRVISECPELRCCKLMVHDPDVAIPISEHPIVELPFLYTLAIRCVASVAPAVSILLMRLSLPGLRDFTIFGSERDSPALGNFFATLLRLENLHVDINVFSEPSLLETFSALPPSIQHIQICDFEHNWGPQRSCLDGILGVLTTSHRLCPLLQHLSIHQAFSLSEMVLLLFNTARMQGSRPTLNRVDINFGRPVLVDIMPDLLAFIELALAVSLVYMPLRPWGDSPWQGLPDAPPNPPTWAWFPPAAINW
ncbi:hypothetical protein C8R45DRAFT_577896 [Mycena sanguinolenta]|nr:hypothetical protein C8R45DRAFT_577896 [Mycena sanguinolenta]